MYPTHSHDTRFLAKPERSIRSHFNRLKLQALALAMLPFGPLMIAALLLPKALHPRAQMWIMVALAAVYVAWVLGIAGSRRFRRTCPRCAFDIDLWRALRVQEWQRQHPMLTLLCECAGSSGATTLGPDTACPQCGVSFQEPYRSSTPLDLCDNTRILKCPPSSRNAYCRSRLTDIGRAPYEGYALKKGGQHEIPRTPENA